MEGTATRALDPRRARRGPGRRRRAGLRLAGLAAVALLAGCAEPPAGERAAESSSTSAGQTVAAPSAEPAAPRRARVAQVVDGDTLVLEDGRRVRLLQVDAPEGAEDECYAGEARAELRRRLPPGTAVRLVADPRLDRVDEHGRLLRYVHARGRNVNLVLVRRGAATVWFYRGERGRHARALLRAARSARAARRGLWSACPGTPFDPSGPADTGRAAAPSELPVSCPGAVSWREAGAHVGERATVEGPVVGTRFAADANGRPTFLNLGRDYPDPNRFTVVVWGDDRARFPEPPEDAYAGRTICVTGEIELYRGVPEIEVSSPDQVAVRE